MIRLCFVSIHLTLKHAIRIKCYMKIILDNFCHVIIIVLRSAFSFIIFMNIIYWQFKIVVQEGDQIYPRLENHQSVWAYKAITQRVIDHHYVIVCHFDIELRLNNITHRCFCQCRQVRFKLNQNITIYRAWPTHLFVTLTSRNKQKFRDQFIMLHISIRFKFLKER